MSASEKKMKMEIEMRAASEKYLKEEIVSSIQTFVKEKKQNQSWLQINELIKEVMEAVTYGIEYAIRELENRS